MTYSLPFVKSYREISAGKFFVVFPGGIPRAFDGARRTARRTARRFARRFARHIVRRIPEAIMAAPSFSYPIISLPASDTERERLFATDPRTGPLPPYRSILHCDLNNFFASAELLDHPELREFPVIVGGSKADRHGIVLAKNYAAKRYGIITGETLSQAIDKCPHLISLPPHYDKYLRLSRAVRSVYERYTDQVEAMGIDECFLDVTASERFFGSGAAIADEIRETVKREVGLTISVGVSFNKVFAKLGSDMKKPDAVTVIPPESFREIVWPLPSRDMLGVGMKTYQKLYYRGIRTVGDIARCPISLMQSYLGKAGAALWVCANGLERSPVMEQDERCPIKSVGHGMTLVADLVSEEEVLETILELTQEVGAKLRKNDLKCGGVAVAIRENDLSWREYQEKFTRSTQLTREIAACAMRLFRRRHVWRNNIRSVSVRAIYVSAAPASEQLDLFFDAEAEEKLLRLERAVDEIRERFGEHAVVCAACCRGGKFNPQRIGFAEMV